MAVIASKLKYIFFGTLLLGALAAQGLADPFEQIKYIPIQAEGRVQSFDSFSRKTVNLISGRQSFRGKAAQTIIFEALNDLDSVAQIEWIRITYRPLLSHLQLSVSQEFYSLEQLLRGTEKIEQLLDSSQSKRDHDQRPSKLEQKTELLYSQITAVKGLASGKSIAVIPGSGQGAWSSPYQGDSAWSAKFKELVLLTFEGHSAEAEAGINEWLEQVYNLIGEKFRKTIQLEVHYYNLKPFLLAWIAYLCAFLLFGLAGRISCLQKAGVLAFILAAFFHSYGLGLRILILDRPPVSNMYESMIFMNWTLVVFACIFSIVQKNIKAVSAGSLISALVMIYSSILPVDSGMSVLVPVLRNNYWLITHVLTIVASYGAFGLAMAMGHGHLLADVSGKLSAENEVESAQLLYRIIQLGIVLLGLGTILGGVWANESWGRFWGWDPKETWALITFLGYLLIIHLRFQRTIDNFWLAVSSIIGFLLVIMTWFGVNFLLGQGLHSYGSISGGLVWIIYYLIFEIIFFGFIFIKTRLVNSK